MNKHNQNNIFVNFLPYISMKYNIVYIGPVYSFWRKVARHNWLAVTNHWYGQGGAL